MNHSLRLTFKKSDGGTYTLPIASVNIDQLDNVSSAMDTLIQQNAIEVKGSNLIDKVSAKLYTTTTSPINIS